MAKSLLFVSSILATSFAFALPSTRQPEFAGNGSVEAVMTFEGQVEMDAAAAPSPGWMKEQIEKQLRYLFGWMTEGPVPAAPRGNHKLLNVRSARTDARTITISYVYEGNVVVKANQGVSYDVALPRNPDTIYAAAAVNGRNPCGDADFQDPGDFWHSFNPRQRGCRLKAGQDYLVFKAGLRRLPSTKISYPEYERLADAQGLIKISFMMGMDDGSHLRDPLASRDINANNFRAIRRSLLAAGWNSRVVAGPEILQVIRQNLPRAEMPYVEELSKDVVQAGTGRRFKLLMRMFYGPTGTEEASTAFHWYLKDSVENSAVAIYDGHSGIGEYLDLPFLERLHGFRFLPPRDRYQIYFFNSCSSYTHYNTMYFGRKASPRDPLGTKNLDIITTGLGTYFDTSHDSNMALINAIELWASGRGRVSYQQLIRDVDSKNLAAVNGDEDNPTR